MMSKELLIMLNKDGEAEFYNAEWDLTIHCESEEDHNRCVEFLQNAYKTIWIPVEERLPENEQYVLVSFENFSMPDIGRYKEDEYGGAFYPGDDDNSYISHGLIVNAWMPLPDPYKEG